MPQFLLSRFYSKVVPAVRERYNDVPVLLVGTKLDTRLCHWDSVGDSMRIAIHSSSASYEQVLDFNFAPMHLILYLTRALSFVIKLKRRIMLSVQFLPEKDLHYSLAKQLS